MADVTETIAYLFDDDRCDIPVGRCPYLVEWIVDPHDCPNHQGADANKTCRYHVLDFVHRNSGCRTVITPWYAPDKTKEPTTTVDSLAQRKEMVQ